MLHFIQNKRNKTTYKKSGIFQKYYFSLILICHILPFQKVIQIFLMYNISDKTPPFLFLFVLVKEIKYFIFFIFELYFVDTLIIYLKLCCCGPIRC